MTTSARQESMRGPTGATSTVRVGGPERISTTELWIRRILGRIIDVIPVAVLFVALWVSGADKLSSTADACNPAPAPNCFVAAQTDRLDEAGKTVIEYEMLDGRVINSEHRTYQLGDAIYIADPPKTSAYVVTLLYVLFVFVLIQGVTGWTPGKVVSGIRLADGARRSPGISRALLRWALPDGAIGMVGVVAGIVGGPWVLRLLAVFVPLGLFRFIGELAPALLGPLSDDRLGMGVVARADFIGGRPERDDALDLRAEPTPSGADYADVDRYPAEPTPAFPSGPHAATADLSSGTPIEPLPIIAAPVAHAAEPTEAPEAEEPAASVEARAETAVSAGADVTPDDAVTAALTSAVVEERAAHAETAATTTGEVVSMPTISSVFDLRTPTGSAAPTSSTTPTSSTSSASPAGDEVAERTPIALGPVAEPEPVVAPSPVDDLEPVDAPTGEAEARQDDEPAAEPDAPALTATRLGPDTPAFPAPPLATESTPLDDAPTAEHATVEAAPADRTASPEATTADDAIATGSAAPSEAPVAATDAERSDETPAQDTPDSGRFDVDSPRGVAETTAESPSSTVEIGGDSTTESVESPASADGGADAAAGGLVSPYPPQWDAARHAYICWEPVAAQWLQWDDTAKTWGPISQ